MNMKLGQPRIEYRENLSQNLCTSSAPRQSHRMKLTSTGVKRVSLKGVTESKERAID